MTKKPSGIMSVDTGYEFWIKDLVSGEEFLLETNLTKDQVKRIKKNMGFKGVLIIKA